MTDEHEHEHEQAPGDALNAYVKEEQPLMMFTSRTAHFVNDHDRPLCGSAHIDPDDTILANVVRIPGASNVCEKCLKRATNQYRYQVMDDIATMLEMTDFTDGERTDFATHELRLIRDTLRFYLSEDKRKAERLFQ